MDNTLHLNEFFVEGGSPEISHVLLHITEPSTPQEKEKGYFFAICEVNSANKKHITKLQAIIDEIENNYYELEDTITKNSLEAVLEKVNQDNPTLKNPPYELHCVVGAVRKGEIIFSYHGAPSIVLFYKNKQKLYQKMDLRRGGGSEEGDGSQMFSQIIQGKISPNDYMLFATAHVGEYFSQDRLQKIITTRAARLGADHIEKVLAELKNGFSFGGLIIHLGNLSIKISKTRPQSEDGSAKSLSRLFNTEKTTAETLSASLLPRLGANARAAFKRLSHRKFNSKNKATTKEEEDYLETKVSSSHLHAPRGKKQSKITITKNKATAAAAAEVVKQILLHLARLLKWIFLALWAITVVLLRFLGMLLVIITNYHKGRRRVLDNLNAQWKFFLTTLEHLPTVTKVLIVSALSLSIIFTGSIFYIKSNQRKQEQQRVYQDAINVVENKRNDAESSLIYQDDQAALADLLAAKNMLEQTNCATKDQTVACQKLDDELNELLNQVRKINIVEPKLLADWNQAMEQPPFNKIVKINEKIIHYSAATSTLGIFNTVSNELTTLNSPNLTAGFTAASVPKENDYVSLLAGDNLMQFSPESNIISSSHITYPATNVNIVAGFVYNRRLYTLDALNGQIYRHSSAQGGFAGGTEWIKGGGIDLSDAVSLTIDGDIFTLHKTGKITKLTKGETAPYEIKGLDPSLTSANVLWTYNDVQFIYVLDTTGKRLIILDREGHLIKQITAAEFEAPSDVVIDELNETAYIIDNARLYQISL